MENDEGRDQVEPSGLLSEREIALLVLRHADQMIDMACQSRLTELVPTLERVRDQARRVLSGTKRYLDS